ncbi:MAG: alpha-amylase [Anaerolineae bacterium]|nr:alpha-amylase [Anaerolineae bacterium]
MLNSGGKPVIYEINTAVWLNSLSAQAGRPVTLADVPEVVIDALAAPGITMIWLMGVWERSAFSRQHALKYKHEYLGALPDMTDEDVIGSAYSIRAYEVAAAFGGREALAVFRRQLQARGLKLMLDYVPNHVGPDHAWADEPGFTVRGKAADAEQRPGDFFLHRTKTGRRIVLAHGRDPYYPGWADTVQLNAFNPALRAEITRTLLDIASQCDGVRCDMAMLFLNDIFARTWAGFVKQKPGREFWAEVIPAIRAEHPGFMFLAEVYWGKEAELLALGFDSVYDKVFYDRLVKGEIAELRTHLNAPLAYQQHVMRFVENHDEPRAFAAFGPQRSYPIATILLTVPGGVLLHEGQFISRRAKLPVQITRAPEEPVSADLLAHYLRLLQETASPVYQQGEFTLFSFLPRSANKAANASLLAYGWRLADEYRLVIANLGSHPADAIVDLSPWVGASGREWRLTDIFDGADHSAREADLAHEGLRVSLQAYASHIYRFEPLD